MIQRSTRIGIIAVLISLFLHFLGLGMTGSETGTQGETGREADVVALDDSFETLVDTVPEVIIPEEAPVPEPPVETPAEAEDVSTSEALVASENPVESFAPDTAAVSAVEPGVTTPQDSDEDVRSDAETTGAVVTEQETPAVQPTPEEAIGIASEDSLAPAGQVQEAQSPVETEPVETVAEDVSEPVEPKETAPVDEEGIETVAVPSVNETPATDSDEVETAVLTSLRPRLPERRPESEQGGTGEAANRRSSLEAPSTTIESPLAAYRRNGTDLTVKRGGGRLSGGLGFEGSGGTGNSDQTNYAGRVLVHLNRAPVVPVSGRGAARVLFVINPDGSLASVDVFDTTGSADIDRAAKAQIRTAAPFPPPPGGARRTLSFVYRIN